MNIKCLGNLLCYLSTKKKKKKKKAQEESFGTQRKDLIITLD